jgi:hypothetical protein
MDVEKSMVYKKKSPGRRRNGALTEGPVVKDL